MDFGEYILDEDGNPRRETNMLKWAMWLGHSHKSTGKDNRIIQQDHFQVHGQEIMVSTVFLGLDQRPYRGRKVRTGKPVLWETMIFGGDRDGYMDRYTSRADAVAGHAVALALAKGETEELEKLYELKDAR